MLATAELARRSSGLLARVLRGSSAPEPFPSLRDDPWQHCRNAIGIARLLMHEGRSLALVDTACCMALDAGCRAASAALGRRMDGGVWRALSALETPRPLLLALSEAKDANERLVATEVLLEWIGACLRRAAPGRAWQC